MQRERRGRASDPVAGRRRASGRQATGLAAELPEALFVVGADETLLLVNAAAEALTGYTATELLGASVGLVLGEADPFLARGVAALGGNDVLRALVHRDGRRHPVRWSGRVLENPGEFPPGTTVCVVRDAADSVHELEGLRGELRRAAVLLDEVRHRAGNHLQVAASLIGLRAGGADSDAARAALEDCRRGVEALALLHERLLGDDALGRPELAEYFAELTTALFSGSSLAVAERAVLELERVSVDASQAAPLGLVFVELVTNALEHAHADGSAPHLGITLERAPGGLCRLTVADDGRGLPPAAEGPGLGLLLVRQLTLQIGGTVRWWNADGAVVEVEFPVAAPSGVDGSDGIASDEIVSGGEERAA